MVILRGELAAWLGLACLHVGVYICMYAVMLGLDFKTCCHMHVEGAWKCMVTLRAELDAWFGLAWLGFRGGGGLRRTDTRMHLDGI